MKIISYTLTFRGSAKSDMKLTILNMKCKKNNTVKTYEINDKFLTIGANQFIIIHFLLFPKIVISYNPYVRLFTNRI